tara:strand:- start:584 stop:1036 length:453 start_codon:yes stop_codon:yes gene_type:complete
MITSIDRIGRSGEFAVASQLALVSDTVSLVPHNSYADIIFEYQRNLYKVQVKTSSKERKYPHKDGDYRIGWTFDLRRKRKSKDVKLQKYGAEGQFDIDIFALYCLPYNSIIFIAFKDAPTKYTCSDEDFAKNDSQTSLNIVLEELSHTKL